MKASMFFTNHLPESNTILNADFPPNTPYSEVKKWATEAAACLAMQYIYLYYEDLNYTEEERKEYIQKYCRYALSINGEWGK